MIDVTLLICTRDRCASLAATLTSVEQAIAQAGGSSIEIIIVDNGSSDDTAQFIRRWKEFQRIPVRLLREDRRGLARARNAGLAHRRGRIVAMTDDDCILHPDYFVALLRAFAAVEAPAIIGGRILLGNPADLPLTVKLEDHPMIADPGVFPGGFVMGANLAFCANVLDRIGLFDERFGAGAPFVAAEDTDFLLRAVKSKIAVIYDPYMMVDHHHGRRDYGEARRLLAGYSFGDGAIYAKYILQDWRVILYLLSDLSSVIRDFRYIANRPFNIRFFYLFRLKHKMRGIIAYCLRIFLRPRGARTSTICTTASAGDPA